MKAECPHCGEVQTVNSKVGDLDVCDNCGDLYDQFPNEVRE